MKDAEILERIKQRDESALGYLYKQHYKMMVRLVTKNSGTEEEAKDIYQDALVVFWQKVNNPDFVLSSKISTFLYSICQNLWRKELERKSKLSREEKDDVVYNEVEKTERIRIIHECMAKLGETCRKVLYYYYFDKLSMNDIADKMGFANSDTAKTKKYKCKKELDDIIKTHYKATDFLD